MEPKKNDLTSPTSRPDDMALALAMVLYRQDEQSDAKQVGKADATCTFAIVENVYDPQAD